MKLHVKFKHSILVCNFRFLFVLSLENLRKLVERFLCNLLRETTLNEKSSIAVNGSVAKHPNFGNVKFPLKNLCKKIVKKRGINLSFSTEKHIKCSKFENKKLVQDFYLRLLYISFFLQNQSFLNHHDFCLSC